MLFVGNSLMWSILSFRNTSIQKKIAFWNKTNVEFSYRNRSSKYLFHFSFHEFLGMETSMIHDHFFISASNMENSAYVPSSAHLNSPALVVFSQAGGLQDALRIQRPFNSQVSKKTYSFELNFFRIVFSSILWTFSMTFSYFV